MEGIDQILDFLFGKIVMVGELEQRDLVVLLKVFLERLGMDDAREQKDVAGILGERTAPFEGNGKTIVKTGEEDFLMGEGVESVPYLVLLLVGEIVRTFGYDDKVGPTALPTAFPEVSERQNPVVVEGAFVFGEEDVDRGLYITMLIDIVEHDNLGLLLQLHEIPNAFHSFLADRRDDIGEFGCHHRGLVAQQLGRRERGWLRGQMESFAFAAVTPTEEGCSIVVVKQSQEILGMGSFSGSSGSKVAYAYGGDGGRLLLEYPPIKKNAADTHACRIPDGKWEQTIGQYLADGLHKVVAVTFSLQR